MKIPWLQVARIGAAIVGEALPGVKMAESLAEQFKMLHGVDKENAVVELVKDAVLTAEGISGRDLLNDPAVEAATRGVIQAIHGLHEAVAKHPHVQAVV